MFGLGLWEGALLVLLITFVGRKWIQRRWPQLGRWVVVVLWCMAAVVLVWDALTFARCYWR